MRIGLIADIHGNLLALESVLHELERAAVDQVICLGDVVALGPRPHAVLERLRAIGCPVVRGNTDDWYLQPVPEEDAEWRALVEWGLHQMTPEDLAYLHSFPPLIERRLAPDTTLVCFHGSPRSNTDVLAATTRVGEVRTMLAGYATGILAGGHTHVQMLRRYEHATIINPGSVGLPGVGPEGAELQRNTEVHWAEYGIVTVQGGLVSIDLRRTALDMAALLEDGYASGMVNFAAWARTWYTPGQAPSARDRLRGPARGGVEGGA